MTRWCGPSGNLGSRHDRERPFLPKVHAVLEARVGEDRDLREPSGAEVGQQALFRENAHLESTPGPAVKNKPGKRLSVAITRRVYERAIVTFARNDEVMEVWKVLNRFALQDVRDGQDENTMRFQEPSCVGK